MAETLIPHAVKFESDSAFKARVTRHTHRPSDYGSTAVFTLNGHGCLVGEEAASLGRPTRITGPDKYVKGHLDVLLMAMLQKLAPDGHNNIILSCAHTTNSIPYISKIADAVRGRHVVTRYDNKQVGYHVRVLIPWDEPAGGLLRFMTHEGVGSQAQMVQPGDKILVIDIGGKISTMIPAIVQQDMQVTVQWSLGKPFAVGIQDVMETLESELRSLHPDVFTSRTVPESIMAEALLNNGLTHVRGREFDARIPYENAVGLLVTEIENVYVNDMNRGLDAAHIVITGGGGGLMFGALKDTVLDHPNVYLADYADTINFANLRGGEYATEQWLSVNADQVTALTSKHGQPLVVIFDPGNTALKGKVLGDEIRHG